MALFTTLQDYNNYIEFLNMKGQPIPQSVLDEKANLEAELKVNDDEYIFSTMAAHNKFMTPEKEKVVREMADQLMMDGPEATQPCLLLGKVQCGKTDTFLSIMGLCFDRGIDIAVVMTKGTNTLTKQTIQRLNKDFRFFKDDGTVNQKVNIFVYDILDLFKRGGLSDYQLNNPASKYIIVAKKENTNLTDLIALWENSALLRSKKVLVCDDEADFASRAYYRRKGEMSLLRIAEHIENFIKLPAYCRYMQITATPYSLYLQPDGTVQLREGEEASPWLPRYTGLVPIHDKYIGGQQYYVESQDPDSMYSCLFQPVDPACLVVLSSRNDFYKESNVHSATLQSLNYAVVSYMFGAAIRSIQKRKSANVKYKSSCLIHCEINQKEHKWQADIITEIIEGVKKAFVDKGNTDLHILDMECEAYNSFKESNKLGNKSRLINEKFSSFSEVEAEVKRILQYNDYTINVVNSEEPGRVATMLNDKGQLELEQTLNFFIGGSILDRGITIDNMLCFFYGRDPKKFQMDTVLQHARMYGARDKADMACTRFFTTEAIYDVLKTMNEFDDCLYNYLAKHRGTVQTEDITSIVIGYDKRIKPSAQNKYTPANTKVLKAKQRILPVGFQTGTAQEIAPTIAKIDDLVKACPDYSKVTDENPFFLMDYETAAQIIHLISSTFRYSEALENMDHEWDENEMMTALDHCMFETDGQLYCLVRTGRNMSRLRDRSLITKSSKWIDAPDDGRTDTAPSREIATDRPVLMLLRQNGNETEGWRNTPFYWPVLVLPQNLQDGIFTINGKRKFKAPKKQLKLKTIDKYPPEQVLKLPIKRVNFFNIILGEQKEETRDIKQSTCSLFLKKDDAGHLILVPGTDPENHYDLSSINNNVFPFEVRDYKYLYLRTSQDYSGSQLLIKLDKKKPYEMMCEPFTQEDVHYDELNNPNEATDDSAGKWTIVYHLDKILETKLTKEDEHQLEDFKQQREEEKAQNGIE